MVEMLGNKTKASLDIFSGVENLDLEYELSFSSNLLLKMILLGGGSGTGT